MNSWFTERLLQWNKSENDRQMPWKGEKDPYKVWLSEIILQQTRVEQGLIYYNAFIQKFPTVNELAAAPDQEVFKLWEGLGYYSRCRNLLKTARKVVEDYGGLFPGDHDKILSLNGVGPYTAAAIASFAFDLPFAVLDGNVYRVLSRVFGIYTPFDQTQGKKEFAKIAQALLSKTSPAKYNQAIMDFGATICKPVSPFCSRCPFNDKCHAYLREKIQFLPVRSKQITITIRWFYYLVFEKNNQLLVRERKEKDIWRHLYEFYLNESSSSIDDDNLLQLVYKAGINVRHILETNISQEFRQQLTHQQIRGRFLHITVNNEAKTPDGYIWVNKSDWNLLPFPKYILSYLKEKG